MKKSLLITSLLLSGATMAQFTPANEPAVGASQTMYLCDSNYTNYSGTTGSGVTWDYSGITQVGTNTKLVSVQDPASTPEGASFAASTKALVIDGFVTTYINSTAAERSSQGFVFEEPTFGTVVAEFSNDNEKLMNYPFAVTNSLTDFFDGTITTGTTGTTACSGNNVATVDGLGTLILNSTTTLTNVLRYKLIDTATTTVPFIGDAVLVRTQFEYYTNTGNNLPVFVHSSVEVTIGGAPQTVNVVLSSVAPDPLGVETNALASVITYPNPATETISVNGLQHDATLTLLDAQGKTISTRKVTPATATMNVSTVQAGVYFLNITSNNQTKVERVIIK